MLVADKKLYRVTCQCSNFKSSVISEDYEICPNCRASIAYELSQERYEYNDKGYIWLGIKDKNGSKIYEKDFLRLIRADQSSVEFVAGRDFRGVMFHSEFILHEDTITNIEKV